MENKNLEERRKQKMEERRKKREAFLARVKENRTSISSEKMKNFFEKIKESTRKAKEAKEVKETSEEKTQD